MDSYRETFETWNKIAGIYEAKFMDLPIYNQTYDQFLKAVGNPNAKILDAGCGPGNITKYLQSQQPGLKIEGVDIAPAMVDLARKNNPPANFQVLDIRNLNQLSNRYHGLICGFSIPYLSEEETGKFIADAYSLLLGKGLLYLSFVAGDPSDSGFQTGSSGDRIFFHYHHPYTIHKALTRSGFKNPTWYRIPYKKADGSTEVHTIVIARKVLGD